MEFDCERTCKSRLHGAWCTAAIIRGSDDEILASVPTKCKNFVNVWDDGGKNVLHVAASCGKRKVTSWLVGAARAKINAKDLESGYTALHRSVFYGQLNCAVELIRLGCNPSSLDHEGLTAMEIALLDRPSIVDLNPYNPCEIYAWGTNSNYNLGVGHDQTRSFPEVMDKFRQNLITIKQVSMDKFHTLFVDADGGVYACGHGTGGRLGLGTQQPQLEPKLVNISADSPVVFAVAALNHSAFLLENGLVLTCGSNQFGQLGQSPQISELDVPKVLPWFKNTKNAYDMSKGIVGMTTSRFHTALHSKKAVYTFGLNGGQLGHVKAEKEQIVWTPRKVTTLDLTGDCSISGIAASEGSTVVTVRRGASGFSDVFVLHEYRCRKVASKLAGDLKTCVVGGNLDAKVAENSGLIEHGGSDLRIMILAAGDRLLIWRGSKNQLTRVILHAPQRLTIADAQLTKSCLAIVTRNGQAFVGNLNEKPSAKIAGVEMATFRTSYTRVMSGNVSTGVDDKVFQFPPEVVRVDRVPGIWRAVGISADPKGKNFIVLQANPKDALYDLPEIGPSSMGVDMRKFYEEVEISDRMHDVVLRINGTDYPAHWFVLRSRCPFFNKLQAMVDDRTIASESSVVIPRKSSHPSSGNTVSMFGYSSPFAENGGNFETSALGMASERRAIPTVDIDVLKGIHPKVVEQLMIFIYSGTCDLTTEGGCPIRIPAESGKGMKFVVAPKPSAEKSDKRGKKKSGKNAGNNKNSRKADVSDVKQLFDEEPLMDPLALLGEAAEKLGWKSLKSAVLSFEFSPPSEFFPNGRIKKRPGSKAPPSIKFFRRDFEELKDLAIVAEDGSEIQGHQCILAARLQYFRSMLGISGGAWSESALHRVSIPLPSDLLEIVIDYLYSDSMPETVSLARDPAVAANVLVVADQLLIDNLKAMCEEAMVHLLTLRNVADLLDFAQTYNARQLKHACFQFISLNASAILETRVLESVTHAEVLDQLAGYYRDFVLQGGRRRLTPYSGVGPTDVELRDLVSKLGTTMEEELTKLESNGEVTEMMPVDQTAEFLKIKVKSQSKASSKKKAPPRLRKESRSLSESVEEEPRKFVAVAASSPNERASPPRSQPSKQEFPAAKKKEDDAEKPVGKSGIRIMPSPVTPQKMAERDAVVALAASASSSLAQVPSSATTFRVKTSAASSRPPPESDGYPALGAPVAVSTTAVGNRNSGTTAKTSPTEATPVPASSLGQATTPGRQTRPVEPLPVTVKTKLSQKQRKKLVSGGHEEEATAGSPSLASGTEEEVSPTKPLNAWANLLPGVSKPTSPAAEGTQNLANLSFEESSLTVNGHRKSLRKSATAEDSFSRILLEEIERNENLERIKTKPLSTILKEDQAIEELLSYYNADGNAEERITVVRCGSSDFAAPVWHKKSSASGGGARLN